MPVNAVAAGGKPVDVWYTVCPVPSAISIAIGKGDLQAAFAHEAGVKLSSLRTHSDLKVREAHYDQTQPNLFREGGNIPPLWARSDGRNLRLLGLTWIEHFSAVIALPESRIRTPGDLKGKRLALINRKNETIDYARATALRGYLAALKHGGVRRQDVTFVDIDIEERHVGKQPKSDSLSSSAFSVAHMRKVDGLFVRALLQGHIDALYVTGSHADVHHLLDAHVVFDAADAPDPIDRINNVAPVAFTVRGELLDSHPDIATAYVAQAVRTARWAKANPREAERYIARDATIVEESVRQRFSPAVSNSLEPSLDPTLVGYLENQKNFLLAEGFIKNDFSIEDFVADAPLRAARKIVDAEDGHGAGIQPANAA
jgi:ABC-type nitrate/sulfonate/bicarbonate transport system substrate-binding protein